MTESQKSLRLRKQNFVKRVSDAISFSEGLSIEEVSYEVYESIENPQLYQEWLIVRYYGGAICVRNVNGDSVSAIFGEIYNLMHGGYYDEVSMYNNMKSNLDKFIKVI